MSTASPGTDPGASPGWRVWLFVALLFSGIGSTVYEPGLRGPLVSDDIMILIQAPWMEDLTVDNVVEILDPRGRPVLSTANWAPAHLLAHLVQQEFFGYYPNTYPYHLSNVLVHGINSTLLAALFVAHGVPLVAALLAGLVFLLHPANVEAVAWVFQLKTLLAFTFGIAALLHLQRRPALSTLWFALAILAKPSAGAVLAAAIVFEGFRVVGPTGPPKRTRWLFAWGGLLVAYSVIEFAAFQGVGEFLDQRPISPFERVLGVVAIVGRYFSMTTLTYGLSVFHQPDPTRSVLDPWFLLGLVTLIGMAIVCVRALWLRHPAAGWLGLVAASYAPVSQIFAFRFPLADRYLYFIIAGLLGALLVTYGRSIGAGFETLRARRLGAGPRALVGAGLAAVLVIGYGAHAYARAGIWRSEKSIDRDAIRHYPNGVAGQLDRARRAVAAGRPEEAVDALEALVLQGSDNPIVYLSDEALKPLRGNPRYEELLKGIARRWLDKFDELENKAPGFGVIDAVLYSILVGDLERAERYLDDAARTPDVIDPQMVEQLRESLQREREALEAAG
ncbi:MAG: hypothetical protein ABFS41_07300 [Myxococcota bacterium]